VIDYLCDWNINKKLENWFKVNFKKSDPKLLSAIHPDKYSERFVNFMKRNIFVDETVKYYSGKDAKLYEVEKLRKEIDDTYHSLFYCVHCGCTYN